MADESVKSSEKKASATAPGQQTQCRQCGVCCGPYFALYVDEPDELRWEAEGRQDLLDRLEWERNHVIWDQAGPRNVKTGERFVRCVFASRQPDGRVLCSIHETKPRICLLYPPGSSEICALYHERSAAASQAGQKDQRKGALGKITYAGKKNKPRNT